MLRPPWPFPRTRPSPCRLASRRQSQDAVEVEEGTIQFAPSNWINAGTYVLEPSVLDRIEPERKVSIEREVFPAMVADLSLFDIVHPAHVKGLKVEFQRVLDERSNGAGDGMKRAGVRQRGGLYRLRATGQLR